MKNFHDLVKHIHSLKSLDELSEFLHGLTTDKERYELARRIDIADRLLRGEPQHKIASDLGVGVATVTRGSKEVAIGRFDSLKVKR